MTPQVCQKCQSFFSAYLDGAVSGRQMQKIAKHLEICPPCAQEFSALRAMQQSLASLGPAKAPATLALSSGSPSRMNRPDENPTGSTPWA